MSDEAIALHCGCGCLLDNKKITATGFACLISALDERQHCARCGKRRCFFCLTPAVLPEKFRCRYGCDTGTCQYREDNAKIRETP